MTEQWSWDQNPINLTCIATGIPNATITWWSRDREIDREIIDRNLKVVGHGPRSDLIVTPLDLQYYGRYTCKAVNPHGEAFQEIILNEAREPSYIQQVRKPYDCRFYEGFEVILNTTLFNTLHTLR